MSFTNSRICGLFFSLFALVSGVTQAATFDASVIYSGPGGTQTSIVQNGTAQLNSEQNSICGGGYYRTCWGTASALQTETINNGLGTLTATVGFTDIWTNNSGQSQSYLFDFALGADLSVRSFENLSPVQSGFSANILVNGVTVWSTSQSLALNQNGHHFSTSGVDINARLQSTPPFAHSVAYSNTVNLGTFAAGSTFSVKYVLSSYSTAEDIGGCGWECVEARASAAGTGSIHQVSAVPEPETYVLFSAGFGLLMSVRRRRAAISKLTQTSAV